MALATVRPLEGETADVTVFSDAWAFHPAERRLYLLSLLGTPTAVHNVQSALSAGIGVRLTISAPQSYELRPATRSMRTRWGRLPSGGAQALCIAEMPDDRLHKDPRLVIAPSDEALADAIYRDLVDARALMGFPAWAAWLARTLESENLLVRLAGPIAAALLTLNEADLDGVIQRGLAEGQLRFPDPA